MGWRDLLDTIGEGARKTREAISPWKYLSATDVAGMAPGGGLVNAWQDSGKGWQNLKAGNYGQAAIDYGNMGLNIAGETPLLKLAAILAPAAKYGGKVWTGASHGQARGHMMRDLPDAEIDHAMSNVESGFIDSKRGYVDRNKAFDIARREDQLLPQIMDKRGELDSAMLIGNGRTTLPPAPPELMPEYQRLQAGARIDPPQPQGIRAFHGSPHDFDKFSLDKIGTGEGAQAYGHGLYFAENEKVAKGYRDALVNKADPEVDRMWSKVNDLMGQSQAAPAGSAQRLALSQEANALREKAMAYKSPNPGKMYEVNINANPDHFLDWDKPLSEQHPRVQEAVQGLGVPVGQRYLTGADVKPYADRLQEVIADTPLKMYPASQWLGGGLDVSAGREALPEAKHALWDAVFGDYKKATEVNGAEILSRLAEKESGRSASLTGTADTSRLLREAGIPGIRYLDQGSRAAGDGSRNLVVFDDKMVEILKKYGWMPGMAVPAGAALEYQQSQTAAPNG